KDVLRCRAVCKSWHSGTSTNAFILDHHHRQPSLPIIQNIEGICRVAGPLVIKRYGLSSQSDFYICNPTTRKCASLPHPPRRPGVNAVTVVAFYRTTHLENMGFSASYSEPVRIGVPVQLPEYFVLTWPTVSQLTHHVTRSSCCPPVHHRGSLHWAIGLNLTVFDSIAETFRQMSRPIELGAMVSLLDMGGSLLCGTPPDYDAETWRFQYRINLLAMEASPPMAVINEHELLIAQRPDRLFRCDTDGLFLGNVESEEHGNHLILTRHRLQESMISLPIFEAQEEDDVNKEPPFLIVL
ncbi:hypothetical protein ZWY2020_025878, partial [Hordeum vulgare]